MTSSGLESLVNSEMAVECKSYRRCGCCDDGDDGDDDDFPFFLLFLLLLSLPFLARSKAFRSGRLSRLFCFFLGDPSLMLLLLLLRATKERGASSILLAGILIK